MLLDQISIVPLFLIFIALFALGSFLGIMAAYTSLKWLEAREGKAKDETPKVRRKRRARKVQTAADGVTQQQGPLVPASSIRPARAPKTPFPDPGPNRHREPPPEPERNPSQRPVG